MEAGSVLRATSAELKASVLAASAILCESTGPLDVVCQAKFWALATIVMGWPEVDECTPGMNNLMLVLKPGTRNIRQLMDDLVREWRHVEPLSSKGKEIEVPVVYGGEHGVDLRSVANHAGLSVDEVVSIHSSSRYTVYFLGAHAGFGYLGGLDQRLTTPRLDKPRLSVPAGTVAIGGVQTAVLAQPGPSGWNLIGHAEVDFFDPRKEPPALLSPGDTLFFRCEGIEK
jgi:KipI family sensor histidine kinase inhibitor